MFRVMDDMEIEINKIDDLSMVHIYELTGADATSSQGCTAIAVYYGTDGKLNINEFDIHYEKLLYRVLEVYGRAENKELIMMDENTRAILEAGQGVRNETAFDAYLAKEPIDFPVIPFESTLSDRYIPMVEYLIVGLYKTMGINTEIVKRRAGWRGAGAIWTSDGTNERMFSIKTRKSDGKTVKISVADFFDGYGELTIEVVMNYDRMDISFNTFGNVFRGKGSYIFNKDNMTVSFEAFYKDKQIFFDSETEEPRTVLPDETLLDGENKVLLTDQNVSAVYRLPWNMTYVLQESTGIYSDIETQKFCGSYIYDGGKYSDISGWLLCRNIHTDIKIRVDSMHLNKMVLKDGRVQTVFVPVINNTLGEYKLRLENRYFID